MNMTEYRRQVAEAAKKQDGTPIYNGSIQHAQVIVENLFSHARSHVDLLSNQLTPRIYGVDKVVSEAELFLASPDHKLRVLTEDVGVADLAEHPLYKAIGENPNVEFRKIPPHLGAAFDFNFMVVDSKCFRYEGNKSTCAAVAAWGDVKGASNLTRLFDVLWGDHFVEAEETGSTVAQV